jgi:Cu/Ag efflux pump CusA
MFRELFGKIHPSVFLKFHCGLWGHWSRSLSYHNYAVARVLAKVPGAADVNVEKVSGLAYLQIEINRDKIARYGINVADVQNVIETAIGGKEASKVYDGLKVFGLAVRFPEYARNDIQPIRELLIPAPSGALIPLGQLSHVYLREGPAQISREMGKRRVVIECNVTGRDIGSFVREAQQKIDAAVKLPPGYIMTWGGQFENQQRAMKRFALVVPITIAAIFLMLFSSFNSVKQAFLIILNIPFAMIGGILALIIGEFNLSMSASVGFIALFGVRTSTRPTSSKKSMNRSVDAARQSITRRSAASAAMKMWSISRRCSRLMKSESGWNRLSVEFSWSLSMAQCAIPRSLRY